MCRRHGVYRLQRGKRGLRQHHLRRAYRRCEGRQPGAPDFRRLAIWGLSQDYCYPCGACRQFLYEFNPQLEICCTRAAGDWVVRSLSEFLPYGFRF